jgi:hypothetical protein
VLFVALQLSLGLGSREPDHEKIVGKDNPCIVPDPDGPSTGFVARLAAFSAGRLGVYFGRRFGSPPGLPGGGITRIVPAPASGVG